jgi:hypothetical protein
VSESLAKNELLASREEELTKRVEKLKSDLVSMILNVLILFVTETK